MNSTPALPEADQSLDVSGLHCPMPLLKAKLALNGMGEGTVLHVCATDAGSWEDFAAYIALSPHEMLHREARTEHFHYWIRKGA